jgi:hypothetical protein
MKAGLCIGPGEYYIGVFCCVYFYFSTSISSKPRFPPQLDSHRTSISTRHRFQSRSDSTATRFPTRPRFPPQTSISNQTSISTGHRFPNEKKKSTPRHKQICTSKCSDIARSDYKQTAQSVVQIATVHAFQARKKYQSPVCIDRWGHAQLRVKKQRARRGTSQHPRGSRRKRSSL